MFYKINDTSNTLGKFDIPNNGIVNFKHIIDDWQPIYIHLLGRIYSSK